MSGTLATDMASCSPFLVDTYLQYEKFTDVFVQWLAQTAASTGKADHLFAEQTTRAPNQPAPETSTGGRLKGKARKLAKSAPSAPKSRSIAPNISLRSFKQLSEIIRSARLKVPASILSLLKNVIRSRKECAAFYQAQGSSANKALEDTNRSHAHFIAVLVEIHETLEPLCAKQKATLHSSEGRSDAQSHLANLFEHLVLGESLEDSTETSIPKTAPETDKKAQTYLMETSEEDKAFAIYCFLRNCTDIRLAVFQTWREYRLRRIPLTLAASFMNIGIEVSIQTHFGGLKLSCSITIYFLLTIAFQ